MTGSVVRESVTTVVNSDGIVTALVGSASGVDELTVGEEGEWSVLTECVVSSVDTVHVT